MCDNPTIHLSAIRKNGYIQSAEYFLAGHKIADAKLYYGKYKRFQSYTDWYFEINFFDGVFFKYIHAISNANIRFDNIDILRPVTRAVVSYVQ